MFGHSIFSSVWVAECHLLGKSCSLGRVFSWYFCNLGIEGGIWDLIASVPGHCFLVTISM